MYDSVELHVDIEEVCLILKDDKWVLHGFLTCGTMSDRMYVFSLKPQVGFLVMGYLVVYLDLCI